MKTLSHADKRHYDNVQRKLAAAAKKRRTVMAWFRANEGRDLPLMHPANREYHELKQQLADLEKV